MTATMQEMMDRAESIQTLEELREACAEYDVKMSPAEEEAFMATKASAGELSEEELDATVGGGIRDSHGRLIVSEFYKCDRITPPHRSICGECSNSQYIFPHLRCMVR